MNSPGDFGGWTRGELGHALQREFLEPLLDSDALPEDRFYANTVHALRRYAKKTKSKLESSIFFLCPEIPESLASLKEIKSGRRLDSGDVELGCKVWFVNLNVQRGRFFEVEIESRNLNEIIDFLMEHGLERIPSVLYSPEDKEQAITFYAQGLNEASTHHVSVTPAFITAEKIKESISILYEGSLKTPTQALSANVKIWNDPGKWHPAEHVEKEIQGRLQSHFCSIFSLNLLVLNEVSTGEGRLDMLLVSHDIDPGRVLYHALLELKALRSFSNSGATPYKVKDHKEWVNKGVVQAIAYQETHRPLHTALCCFDMCKESYSDEYWFEDSKDSADKAKIFQWRWRLYNSADAYRMDKYARSSA
ncbi:hypothetical protein ACTAB8_18730 [Pseudomonas syringae]|uniref:hypothetical protein n=1 Tax=Pseudomonas viridiflava TaxID=33069 RepID=UPI001179D893|nr:hypothetical protein [Pseudomonas viridiflava]